MKQVQINGEKLRRIFTERKVNMAQAGRDIGYSSTYLSNCCGEGSISKAAAQLLEVRHGIMLDDYIYVEPPKPIAPPVAEQTAIEEPRTDCGPVVALDMGELQKAVALAISDMQADYNAIRGAVREGILDALYQIINNSDMRDMVSGLLISAHKSALELHLRNSLNRAKREGQ